MADGDRCDCGSTLDLRDVHVDAATGPSIIVTVCGLCAAGPVSPCPVPESVARILARRAGVRLPREPSRLSLRDLPLRSDPEAQRERLAAAYLTTAVAGSTIRYTCYGRPS